MREQASENFDDVSEFTSRDIDLITSFGIHKHDWILDMGCGNGRHSLALVRKGFKNVVGFDLSLSKIPTAQEIPMFFVANWYNLPFIDSTFNLAYSIAGYVPTDGKLSEVTRVLKTGGSFLFDTRLYEELAKKHSLTSEGFVWEKVIEFYEDDGQRTRAEFRSVLDPSTHTRIEWSKSFKDTSLNLEYSVHSQEYTLEDFERVLTKFGISISKVITIDLENSTNMLEPKTYILATKA